LVALAEQRPEDETGLARIPGIGATKRQRYGAQVLSVLGGEDPATVAAQAIGVPQSAAAALGGHPFGRSQREELSGIERLAVNTLCSGDVVL
jgi:hypothetical protein